MRGLSMATLKKNSALMPLFGFLGLGVAAASFYVLRLATRSPDVQWGSEATPWQRMRPTDQYKFYAAKHNYRDLKHPEERPDI